MSTEIAEYIAWLQRARQAQPSTVEKYDRILHTFAAGVGTDLSAATPGSVENFCTRPRRTGAPPAPATIAVERAILASFYRWAQARHGWPTNPAELAARPRVHNRHPNPIDDDLWLQVWTSDLPLDACVAIGLGFFCGLRRAEIVALRGSQADLHRRTLVDFVRKGGGTDRFDYGDVLDHFAWSMPHLEPGRLETPLRRLVFQRGSERVMPWQSRRPQSLNKRLSRWLAEAGYPGAFAPHRLRHSFATNLLRSGVPLDVASDLCNHSSPAITMRYVRTAGGRLAKLRQPEWTRTRGQESR